MPAPEWAPAWVASAARRRPGSADDLLSGRSWRRLLTSLERAADTIASDAAPADDVDRAGGYRHLLVLVALGVDEALRDSDPYRPRLSPGNVDNVFKWGMDCPDAAYLGTPVRSDAVYVVRGRRNSVRYLGFQVMGGMASLANVVADDLQIAADGRFELTLSSASRPGNWMELGEEASSLVVRQFFYDWTAERAAELTIECVDGPARMAAPPAPLDPGGVGAEIEAIGEFVEASVRFWLDVESGGRAQGVNCFRPPAALTGMGAAAENVSTWGSWSLAPDEALVIEVTPPPALYWSVSLGTFWWESIDYAARQSSLNGAQATLDGDGVFRAVVAHDDPGYANWLDTAGNRHGVMIFRWLRAESAPVPSVTMTPVSALADVLPAGAATVTAWERGRTLAARRAAVHRRFRR